VHNNYIVEREARIPVVDQVDVVVAGGGYVAGASHDYILEETPVENVLTMFDTVFKYGRYS